MRESRTTDPKTRRQPHLRKQPVDEQLIFGGDLGVEELRVVVGVAAQHDDATGQPSGVLGPHATAIEVERRADAALGEGAHLGIPRRAESPGLAEGADDAVLVQPVAAFGILVGVDPGSLGRRLTDVIRLSDRFLPPRLRRVTSKKARGAM